MTRRLCRGCAGEFESSDLRRQYCDVCHPADYRAKHAAYQTSLHVPYSPEYYASHRDNFRAARQKSYARTCIKCGQRRIRTDVTKSEAHTFVCRDCKTEARLMKRIHACPCCGGVTYRRLYCDECAGLQSTIAIELGLSRERVRQLMNKVLHEVPGLTKRAALEHVRMQRKAVA